MQKVVTPTSAAAACPTCKGNKVVAVIQNKGTVEQKTSQVRCPSCGGSGQSGLRTK